MTPEERKARNSQVCVECGKTRSAHYDMIHCYGARKEIRGVVHVVPVPGFKFSPRLSQADWIAGKGCGVHPTLRSGSCEACARCQPPDKDSILAAMRDGEREGCPYDAVELAGAFGITVPELESILES